MTIRAVRATAIVLGLFFSGEAMAAEPVLDRSTLSYDENVTVNIVCFAASKQSKGAYDGCVKTQLAALKAHPTPDRSNLSGAKNQQVERACNYQRRVGIGEYNECLKKEIERRPAAADSAEAGFQPNIAKVFAQGPDRPPAAAAIPVSLPLPSKLLPALPSPVDRQSLSAAEVFKKVEKSVFVVYATPSLADARTRNVAIGSAVAVGDHLLVTNCHIVNDRPVIRIMREEMEAVAMLVASDAQADRCLLQSEGQALAPVAGIRLFKDLTVGERVYAIGTPRGLDRTLTQGIVSGLRKINGRNLVQTDAPISHGNSGGGLFDESGNLVGITTLTLAVQPGYQNLNFAVAASDYWEQK